MANSAKPDFRKLERDAQVFDRAIADARAGRPDRHRHPDTGEEIEVTVVEGAGVISLSTPTLGRFYRMRLASS
jgi:hypothetical protein